MEPPTGFEPVKSCVPAQVPLVELGEGGVKLPEKDFWVDLSKIAEIIPALAQSLENDVKNAYTSDFQHYKVSEKAKSEDSNVTPETKVDTYAATAEGNLARFTIKDVGYVDIKDRDTFEIAKAYLKVLAKKLGIEE